MLNFYGWFERVPPYLKLGFNASLYVGYSYNGKAFNASLSPLPSIKSRKSKVNPYSDYLRCE